MNRSVFWDRDGIINDLVEHNGKFTAPWDINEFKFKPDIKKSIDIVKDLGYMNFVVSNQPDLNDGWLLESHLNLMNRMITNWLGIDAVFNSLERGTPYYKPNSQSIYDISDEYSIDRTKSFMVGDTWKDIVCGFGGELQTIFVGDKYECPKEYNWIEPTYKVKTTLEAAILIQEVFNYD